MQERHGGVSHIMMDSKQRGDTGRARARYSSSDFLSAGYHLLKLLESVRIVLCDSWEPAFQKV